MCVLREILVVGWPSAPVRSLFVVLRMATAVPHVGHSCILKRSMMLCIARTETPKAVYNVQVEGPREEVEALRQKLQKMERDLENSENTQVALRLDLMEKEGRIISLLLDSGEHFVWLLMCLHSLPFGNTLTLCCTFSNLRE